MKEEEYQNEEQQNDAVAETGVKKFIEEFTNNDQTTILQTPKIETEALEEPHLYHCSECNINFPSIQEHIDSCHKDQEVVFQVDFLKLKFVCLFIIIHTLDILYNAILCVGK